MSRISQECILVPAYSFGYIKIPIDGDIPLKEAGDLNTYNFILYPNPAGNAISILEPSLQTGTNQILNCTIYNTTGAICHQSNIENGGSINVADLAQGVYSILINFGNGAVTSIQFVKQ